MDSVKPSGLFSGAHSKARIVQARRPADQSASDPREKSSYYQDKAWAPQYWREFKSSRTTQYLIADGMLRAIDRRGASN